MAESEDLQEVSGGVDSLGELLAYPACFRLSNPVNFWLSVGYPLIGPEQLLAQGAVHSEFRPALIRAAIPKSALTLRREKQQQEAAGKAVEAEIDKMNAGLEREAAGGEKF